MEKMINFHRICLQLLAEGAAGDGGATGEKGSAAGSQTGVSSNPLAGVIYGKQDEVEVQDSAAQEQNVVEKKTAKDREAEFEKLIKGEYKDLYSKRMENTIRSRLKSTQETVSKYEALSPLMSMLGEKYGVDANDVAALTKAIEDDSTFYEDEALERGISVDELKKIKAIERENTELKRKMAEENSKQNAAKIYSDWMSQAESAKSVYPNFDLRSELQNSQFQSLLRAGIDVRTAYEVIHKDEIIPGAMQFAVQQAEGKLARKVAANAARPPENGSSSQATAIVKSDVASLTKADRAEIIRRVQRGERIRF